MASEAEATSDSLDVSVVDVPRALMDYVKSSIIEYFSKAEDISAKIHYGEGQSPRMVVSFGTKSAKRVVSDEDLGETNTIVVTNVPSSVDEELLEIFFESTKRQGGGPVKNVKVFRDNNTALVEFCEGSSVETVMKKKPIKFGDTELHIQPYKPLLKEFQKIDEVDFKGLQDDFTDGLLKKHLDYVFGVWPPSYGPELTKLIKVGSRVVRGRDWYRGDEDGRGEGTVVEVYSNETAKVRWDNGNEMSYLIGLHNCYAIKLAL